MLHSMQFLIYVCWLPIKRSLFECFHNCTMTGLPRLLEDLVGAGTADTSVVWLDSDLGDLAIVGDQCVSLASVVAKECCRVELNVEGTSELACGVTHEANAGALVCVERLGPSLHDEGIVDGDNENLAGRLELVGGEVAGDVGVCVVCGQ